MRLIDADKLNPDRMTNKGTVAISQSQIAKAPTIQAVPIDVLDKIRAEIDRQEKWLLQAGYTAYNVDIAFDAIKAVLAERSEE